jgi:uncharacterized protein YbaP (TraB family)
VKKILLSILLVLLFCTQSLAESSVWKVQKDGSVIYLGGTFHLLRQSDFPLPIEFEQAYRASDVLVFETDLEKFSDPSTQQKLMAKAIYSDGSTIDEHLSPQTYNLLNEYFASNGMPIAAFKQFKPSIVVLAITVMELAKLGVTQEGVDMFLYELAAVDNKITEGLETVEEQISFVVGMGEGNEDAFVTHSIRDLATIKQKFGSMVDAWKRGDAKKLNDLMIAEFKTKTPKLYEELITDRNVNWLPMIDAYQKTLQKEFILVGVGHLVGPDGIVEALKQKGYKVEKL